MIQVWLKPNRRILQLVMLYPAALVALGLALAWRAAAGAMGTWAAVVGGVAVLLGCGLMALLVLHWRQPRIGFRDGQVLFFLRAGPPVATPMDVVEAFFLGQGPAMLPAARAQKTETVNLIARIAERAEAWQHVGVKPALGHWCDGYVTIRGTWCEPLSEELVRRLNHTLAQAKRESRKGHERD